MYIDLKVIFELAEQLPPTTAGYEKMNPETNGCKLEMGMGPEFKAFARDEEQGLVVVSTIPLRLI